MPAPITAVFGGSERGGAFWRDLRPSEDDRLRTLLYEAEQRATASAHELILQEYAIAVRTFAAEHPDAPRAARELVTA